MFLDNIFDHRTVDVIANFNITWQEDENKQRYYFDKAFNFAKEVLEREIVQTKASIDGENMTNLFIKEQNNPEILILEKKIDWQMAVSKNKNIKLVVYPRKNKTEWCAEVGRDDLNDFDSRRANMPENWWSLRDDDLERESAIKGAIFCIGKG